VIVAMFAALLAAVPPAPAGATPSGGSSIVNAAVAGSAVLTYGDALNAGSLAGTDITAPIVGMAADPSGGGYWLVAADGGVFSFGNAPFYGSAATYHLAQPIVGMAADPSGEGYWLVAADGGVFSFGDAGFYGSTGNVHLAQPIVGMAAAPSGHGYWLVAADGGIFTFGDAPFYGSAAPYRLTQPIVGMAALPASGRGYWLVAADGGVFSFGAAGFHGSAADTQLNQPVIAMAATPDGGGYWLAEGQRGAQSPFTPALVSSLLREPGLVSAAVLDLDSGRMFQYRPFENITASIVKVDILETLLYQAQAAGSGLSAAQQATATTMIEQSDNDSASTLYTEVGGPGPVGAYDRAAGLVATTPNSAWGLTTTTAADQVTLVDRLAQPNALLAPGSRAYALNLMEHITPSQAWGVSAGVGPGATVALKNGWLPVASGWAVNSIGWIDGDGRDYILAVLTADQPSEQTGIDTISQIAGTAWASLTS
jgi:beta-lactamase class A